jgi:hypothetical protein
MPYNHNSYKPVLRHKNAEHNTDLPSLSRWHLAGIVICTILLMGDFLTTTIALSMAEAQAPGSASLSEGNPLMIGLVSDPFTFLMSKLAILGLVVAAAYILRNNGKMAYMPYAIVGSMYLFVVLNNLNLLLPAL